MTKGVKMGLAIGCGGLLVLGVVILVGGYFAMNYLEKNLGEAVKQFDNEGREFGARTDKQGCMNEGVQRSKSIGLIDLNGAMAVTAFVDACLESSKDTPNFCEGVPSFWSMEESQWGADLCRKAGVDPEKTGCVHVFKRKHQFCNK